MQRALGSRQSSVVIRVPAGVYQLSSSASTPVRKRRRRNTGCARRSPTSFLVKPSSSSSGVDQSNQLISLSWQ